MADWLVAICQPHMEVKANAALTDLGFFTYQPRYRERIIRHGRKLWIERLLLGRYLLVQFCTTWLEALRHRTVHSIIMAEGRPQFARDNEVYAMRRSEIRGYIPIKRPAPFAFGQRVVITRGPLAKHTATYEGADDREHDFVSLELLGQMARVELLSGSLVAA